MNIVVEGIAHAGVFGNVICGEIKNLGVAKGSYISASGAMSAAGGIAGGGSGTITGCYNMGTVSAGGFAGGITGGIDNSAKIIGCYNTGAVTATGGSVGDTEAMSYAGGIAGGNGDEMVGCYNTGAVKATGGKISYAGGIVGGVALGTTISGCYYLAGSADGAVGEIDDSLKIENVEEVAEEQMADLAEKLNEAIEEYKQTELAAIKDILQLETAPTTLDEAKSKLKTQLEASKKKLPDLTQLEEAIAENENRVAVAGERDNILNGAVGLFKNANKALGLAEAEADPTTLKDAQTKLNEKKQKLEELPKDGDDETKKAIEELLPKIEETLEKIDEFLKLSPTGNEDGKKCMEELKEAILTETNNVLELTDKLATLAEAKQELGKRINEEKDTDKKNELRQLELRIVYLNPWELETNIGKVLKETKEVLELTDELATLAEAKEELNKKLGAEKDTDKKNKLQQLLDRVEELEIQNSALECEYKVWQDVKNAVGLSTVPVGFNDAKTKLGDKQREENELIGKVEEKLATVELLQTLFENLLEDGKVFKSAAGRYPALWCEGQQSQIPSLSKGVNIGHVRSGIGGDSGFYKASNGVVTFKVVPNPGYKISRIVTSGSRIIRPGDVVKALPECVKVSFKKV